jgi:ribose transport system substrate-binding protein
MVQTKVFKATAVAALALTIAAACGRDGDGGEPAQGGGAFAQEIEIGWTPPDITGVFKTATNFFELAAQGANDAGGNVKIISRSPATHTAFADQLAIIEDFISRGVDVIAISPADVEAVKPAIRQANDAGIPVIMVNLLEQQPDIEVASYIGFDNSEAASVSAYSVLDYYGGPGVLGTGEKVDVAPDQYLDLEWWEGVYENAAKSAPRASGVIIEGIAGTFFSQERLDGFNAVVNQYPGIEILGRPLAADWNREKGIRATEAFTSRYTPQEMNFIWAASNEMGLGAMLTLERKGILDDTGGATPPAKGDVAVFTNDVTPESVAAIKEGRIIAETHHGFAEWGWFGTRFGVMLACGLDVPQSFDIKPRTVWEGNADLFYPDIALPEIDWEQIRSQCTGQ